MERKICGIYKITSPSGKIYIGQSVNIHSRWRWYKKDSKKIKKQRKLFYSLRKYGSNNHIFEIICECRRDELDELEQLYILIFDCFDTKQGLNLRAGGNGGGNIGSQTREKLRRLNIGKKLSEETKTKIGIASKGNQYRLGHKASEETKKKMGEAHIGNKNMLGKKLSEETKKKMSESHKGLNTWSRGRKLSESTRKKLIGRAPWNKGLVGVQSHTEEFKNRMRKLMTGRKMTARQCKNVSIGKLESWKRIKQK